VLLAVIALLAQAARDAPEGLSPAALAAIMTGCATGGAALIGAITAWRKRKDEAHKMETEEDSITITQAQGANLILDATVKALDKQLEREAARADREGARAERAETRLRAAQARVEHLDEQVDAERARADTATRALDVCRRQLGDSAR
jgi:hypothetical protein